MSAVAPRIRERFERAPILTLACGGAEGPAQRIRIETFVEQVKSAKKARGRRQLAGKQTA